MSRREVKTNNLFTTRHAVKLNIYDMGSANEYLERIGLGIYHSGTHVFDSEFSYGGHPFDGTGIFEMTPKCAELLGTGVKHKETILIGFTTYSEESVRKILNSLGKKQFRGKRYHLFNNNCNHFTNQIIQELCCEEIPNWVNRMARISSYIPFLEKVLPIEILSPYIVAQSDDRFNEESSQQMNKIINIKKNSRNNQIV